MVACLCTGEFTRVMTWLPNSQELVFAAGNVIVIMHSKFSITNLVTLLRNVKHTLEPPKHSPDWQSAVVLAADAKIAVNIEQQLHNMLQTRCPRAA